MINIKNSWDLDIPEEGPSAVSQAIKTVKIRKTNGSLLVTDKGAVKKCDKININLCLDMGSKSCKIVPSTYDFPDSYRNASTSPRKTYESSPSKYS